MYSSIETEERKTVIDKCYWPLLNLIAKSGIRTGIESSGYTLEVINEIDKTWITTLKQLIASGKTEFIGSGYSQIIGPLVPYEVNSWNQRIGNDTYQKLLDTKPQIALVNEMAFSSGIIEHYLNNGYKAVIMEWNNPRKYHPEWNNEWRYFPQMAMGNDQNVIPVIWADSIAFQKFQRYVYGEIDPDEYFQYIRSHVNDQIRYFPLYANDIEIFDFRPGRYKSETQINESGNEWGKISGLFKRIQQLKDVEMIFPSEIFSELINPSAGNHLRLESPEQPIPVKKQEKYNISRWALTGRDDLEINTGCYSIYKHLKENEITSQKVWKDLCYLWSSDFRTHITDKRWKCMIRKLFLLKDELTIGHHPVSVEETVAVVLPYTSAGYKCFQSGKYLIYENEQLYAKLNTQKGFTFERVHYPGISRDFLFGTLPHGYFDDISLGADFFSGHAVIEIAGTHKITDLITEASKISKTGKALTINTRSTPDNTLIDSLISFDASSLILEKKITLDKRKPQIIRPFHFTFNPEAFDAGSLYYATHNGGHELEYFSLQNSNFQHHHLLSPLISSTHGLGATKGLISIGDDEKEITFHHDITKSALIPSIEFRPAGKDMFFLRLVYSAGEIDETLRPHHSVRTLQSKIQIRAGKKVHA